MYRSYKTPVTKAYPDVKIPEPRISKSLIILLKILSRLYLFFYYGIAKIIFEGSPEFYNTMKRILAGESRCLIAFRHSNGGEPPLLGWLFLYKLKGFAARNGVRFARHPHALFIYGYEVARWGGWLPRFIMSRLGAMPVHHSKMDSQGMNRIYNALVEGPYPLALAPEGQVSYTTDAVPRLEPGVVRIGFNAAQRLAKKAQDIPVEILPVSVYFRYGVWGRATIELLLRKIEKYCGFPRRGRKHLSFTERIRQCRDHILHVNEERYRIKADPALSFAERLEKVIAAALETAERMVGVKGEGELFPRMYWLRQYCWDKIFLPDVESLGGMTPVERNVKDLEAGEAWYIGRHQEIVDFCWYFRHPLPTDETALHNKIEYVQNLWDFTSRTMGGAYADRINTFPRKVIIQTAPAINLSQRLPSYQNDRKAAISAAMSDLETAYLDCIKKASAVVD